ncbi:MAG: TonB-dependent receptor plug domain-containing protein, partial [Lacisediminimonas sp.]|nr:TonB-dependent receptor plug domain-containing protein [Lacisediminimonas sp.]
MKTTKKVTLAILLGHACTHHAFAQSDGRSVQTLPEVQVTAQPGDSSPQTETWSPDRILTGDELRNRMGSSLGETLGNEAGVATSGFGAAAARPIIRGLDGSRVKILQNGMSVMDVSTLSQDHAVGVSTSNSRQVEIVRGPRALLYGSGVIGGTVNVINDRIPTELPARPGGEAELRLGSVDSSSNGSVSVDGAAGKIGLHVDASALNAGDYRIPGYRIRNDPASAQDRLPQTYSRQQSLGAGGAYIGDWGHAGLSVTSLANHYGVPMPEGANIELVQQRIDFDTLWRYPSPAFDSFQLRL